MNNKGFAITTILYGVMVLFCLLLVSLLGILSSYRKTQERLVEATNGARDVINGKTVTDSSSSSEEPGEPSSSSSSPSSSSSSSSSSGNIKYRISFNCNGGTYNSNHKPTLDAYAGTEVELSDYTCVGNGVFMGWNEDSNATRGWLRYVMKEENVVLYGVWRSSSGDLVTE